MLQLLFLVTCKSFVYCHILVQLNKEQLFPQDKADLI